MPVSSVMSEPYLVSQMTYEIDMQKGRKKRQRRELGLVYIPGDLPTSCRASLGTPQSWAQGVGTAQKPLMA